MGLTRIDEFCASLTASLGGEITYKISTDAISLEMGHRVHTSNKTIYILYINGELIDNIRVADYTLYCVLNNETSTVDGVRMYMSFAEYADLLSANIHQELKKSRKSELKMFRKSN